VAYGLHFGCLKSGAHLLLLKVDCIVELNKVWWCLLHLPLLCLQLLLTKLLHVETHDLLAVLLELWVLNQLLLGSRMMQTHFGVVDERRVCLVYRWARVQRYSN